MMEHKVNIYLIIIIVEIMGEVYLLQTRMNYFWVFIVISIKFLGLQMGNHQSLLLILGNKLEFIRIVLQAKFFQQILVKFQ